MEILTTLYHGSLVPNIDVLRLNRRYTPSGLDVPPRIYASDLPSFAVAHGVPWSSREGFDTLVNDESEVEFRVPNTFRDRINVPVYLYECASSGFMQTPDEGTGHTFHSETEISPCAMTAYESVEEAFSILGGTIIYLSQQAE